MNQQVSKVGAPPSSTAPIDKQSTAEQPPSNTVTETNAPRSTAGCFGTTDCFDRELRLRSAPQADPNAVPLDALRVDGDGKIPRPGLPPRVTQGDVLCVVPCPARTNSPDHGNQPPTFLSPAAPLKSCLAQWQEAIDAQTPGNELRALIAKTRSEQRVKPAVRMSAVCHEENRQRAVAEARGGFVNGFKWIVASLFLFASVAGGFLLVASNPLSVALLVGALAWTMIAGTVGLYSVHAAIDHIRNSFGKLREVPAKGSPHQEAVSTALKNALQKSGRDLRPQEGEDRIAPYVLRELDKNDVFHREFLGKQVVVKVPEERILLGIIQSAIDFLELPDDTDPFMVRSECASDLHRALNDCLFETRNDRIKHYFAEHGGTRRLALQFSFGHDSSKLQPSPIQLTDTNRSQILFPNLGDIECLKKISKSIELVSDQNDTSLLFQGLLFWSSVGLVTRLEEFVSHLEPADKREDAKAARECWEVFKRSFAKIEKESFNCPLLLTPIDEGKTVEDRVAVCTPDGKCYSRSQIYTHLSQKKTNERQDPVSGEALAISELSAAPEYDVALKFWRQLQARGAVVDGADMPPTLSGIFPPLAKHAPRVSMLANGRRSG